MFEGFANVWTPVGVAKELRKEPLGVEIAGEKLVLFRDGSGGVGALVDRCPHRNVALSRGRVDEHGNLECPFHGWSFQKDGACAHIPLNDIPADRRARYGAAAVPAREVGGLLWVFTGPDPRGTEPEPPPALVEPGWHVGFHSETWNAHWTRTMENMLDVPHLPFVHGKSIARDIRKNLRPDGRLQVRIDPAPFGGRVFSAWYGEPEQAILNWRRPNAMELFIIESPKRRWRLHMYCVPVNRERTKMILCSARTFLGFSFITWLMMRSNNVLSEDRHVIESTDPLEAPPPGDELSVPTDGPTLYFRKYYYRDLRGSTSALVPAGRLARKPEGAPEPPSEAADLPAAAGAAVAVH